MKYSFGESSMMTLGADNLCRALHARGRKAGFPRRYSEMERADSSESTREWFVRCVNTYAEGEPDLCSIDDAQKIGVFARAEGNSKQQLLYLNIQVVVTHTEWGLLGLYKNEEPTAPVTYLRMDYDPHQSTGLLFREPHPHIHRVHEGPAWHSFPSSHPVPALVSFIFRNWAHDTWVKWAKREWGKVYHGPIHEDPFPRVESSFATNKIVRDVGLHDDAMRIRVALQRSINQQDALVVDTVPEFLRFDLEI